MAITATLTTALATVPVAAARAGGGTAAGGATTAGGATAAGAGAAAGTTGRLLVQLKPPPPGKAEAAAVNGVAAGAGAKTAISVPRLRIAAVQPRTRGQRALRALEARLKRDPRVASVRPELRFSPRYVPDDPAMTAPERGDDGTTVEWWAARENLTSAWDTATGEGARVAIIDTGVDATHPELQNKILASADFDSTPGDGPATTDEDGHGTHVASLACGEPDNGIGIAGAGLDCGLLIAKSDLSETSVIAALTWAADNGAEAINMSFGADSRFAASPQLVQALQYANSKGAVLVAAAADVPSQEQGIPANVLQPNGTGADINTNFGLTVTAADARDRRADFAGLGSQVSMAAYGTYGGSGPRGILGAFPAQRTLLERRHRDPSDPLGDSIAPCQCRTRFEGDSRYAYLRGTSMAAPQVAGVAALMRHLNPDLPPADVVRILKQTAARPGADWSPDLGWGILDAGAAVAAARSVDFHPPTSQLERPKVRGRSILLRWRGEDDAVAGVVASGIDHFEIWRATPGHTARRLKATVAHSLRLRGKRGSRYSFFTIAVDHAGNREPPPVRADASVRVAR
ncbi:S8 family peptidase [Conexibacter woesei]|uniref:S8 family peptidase n=1 Tax=Conexibacter woesei TaxID=191495 RepID=UPI000405EF20|nr:S8 family serine peptidase [Conexibacter woesei]